MMSSRHFTTSKPKLTILSILLLPVGGPPPLAGDDAAVLMAASGGALMVVMGRRERGARIAPLRSESEGKIRPLNRPTLSAGFMIACEWGEWGA